MEGLSVVIPVLGRHEALGRALAALGRQRDAGGFEVVLVADAADPDPAAVQRLAGRAPLAARVLRAERPGASDARNVGWRAARGEVVLFLGADVLAAPDLLARHAAAHHRHPGAEVALLGRVRWASGLRVTPFMRWLDRGVQFDYEPLTGETASWAHLYTANVSLKRELLARAGGFDAERFPFLYEDLDLGLRLREHGLVVRYDRHAIGEHDHPQTPEDWRARMAAVARAERAFVARHPDQRPYFHDRLADALDGPPGRGLGRPLTGLVGPRTPLVGRRVWRSADRYYRRYLAPAFLEAWTAAGQPEPVSSAGSPPAGPK